MRDQCPATSGRLRGPRRRGTQRRRHQCRQACRAARRPAGPERSRSHPKPDAFRDCRARTDGHQPMASGRGIGQAGLGCRHGPGAVRRRPAGFCRCLPALRGGTPRVCPGEGRAAGRWILRSVCQPARRGRPDGRRRIPLARGARRPPRFGAAPEPPRLFLGRAECSDRRGGSPGQARPGARAGQRRLPGYARLDLLSAGTV